MCHKDQPIFKQTVRPSAMILDLDRICGVSNNTHQIDPNKSDTYQRDQFSYAIGIRQMCIFKIKTAGFEGFEHGLYLPAVFLL